MSSGINRETILLPTFYPLLNEVKARSFAFPEIDEELLDTPPAEFQKDYMKGRQYVEALFLAINGAFGSNTEEAIQLATRHILTGNPNVQPGEIDWVQQGARFQMRFNSLTQGKHIVDQAILAFNTTRQQLLEIPTE